MSLDLFGLRDDVHLPLCVHMQFVAYLLGVNGYVWSLALLPTDTGENK